MGEGNQDGGKEKCEPEGSGEIVLAVSGTLPRAMI